MEILGGLTIGISAIFSRPLALVLALIFPKLKSILTAIAERFHRGYRRLDEGYSQALHPILRRPGLVLGIASASVLMCLPVWNGLGQALIPELHQGRFTAEIALPVGTPLSHTVDRVRRIEASVLEHPNVAHVHTVVGTERRADSRPDEGEHTARIMVEIHGGGALLEREEAVMDVLRQAAKTGEGPHPELRMRRPSLFTFRTPIEVVIFDRNLDRLAETGDIVEERLGQLDRLTDVRSSLTEGYPEVRIRYDRDLLARYNLTTAVVAQRVREKVLGSTATTLSQEEGRVDLTVRLAAADRRGLSALRRINVNPQINPPIPLESVANFEEAIGPSEIRRIDQRRSVVVTANMAGFDLNAAAVDIQRTMRDLNLSSDWEIAGKNREMQRSMSSMKLALGLAVFLIYVIMASTFESVIHPFVIMISVPLALVGVVLGLGLTNTAVSVVVLIGAIVLTGVVVNNAIVLVDTINRQRADGLTRSQAIHKAATLRLRPILITTMTTVLGLLPLALGAGEGAEIQRPLALTIISGLLSATLLTLVVIPVVYQIVTRLLDRREPEPE